MAVDKEGDLTVNGRRLTDAAGSPLKAEGKERSLITGISRDANGNAVFTLGDGSTVSAPVFDAFNIVLLEVGDTVLGDEYVVEDASQPLTIGYEITGEKAGETILKMMRAEKLTATADTAAGTIAVAFGNAFEEGSFAVMLCDTEENVLIRVVRLAAKSAKPEILRHQNRRGSAQIRRGRQFRTQLRPLPRRERRRGAAERRRHDGHDGMDADRYGRESFHGQVRR